MNKKTCLVLDCTKPVRDKDWCGAHYQRWRRHGDPTAGGPTRFNTPKEAFANFTRWEGECLIWTASLMNGGYGQIWTGTGMEPAHRFAWEQKHGPIPKGMVIDHKDHCDRRCCNTAHLRLATTAQNIANRSSASPHNKSTKIRNVYPHGKKWRVRLGYKGKRVDFGTYSSIAEAQEVAKKARRKLFGDYAGKP